jgi:hypothetical protein
VLITTSISYLSIAHATALVETTRRDVRLGVTPREVSSSCCAYFILVRDFSQPGGEARTYMKTGPKTPPFSAPSGKSDQARNAAKRAAFYGSISIRGCMSPKQRERGSEAILCSVEGIPVRDFDGPLPADL